MSDDPLPEGGPFTQAEVDAINAAQWEAQAQWAASVPGAEVITVPDTTHYVQNQRPDAVVEAIRACDRPRLIEHRPLRRPTTAHPARQLRTTAPRMVRWSCPRRSSTTTRCVSGS